jgi:hypothetical protein
MNDAADIYERARHIILMVIKAQRYLDERYPRRAYQYN